jgi:hypothetical protein
MGHALKSPRATNNVATTVLKFIARSSYGYINKYINLTTEDRARLPRRRYHLFLADVLRTIKRLRLIAFTTQRWWHR